MGLEERLKIPLGTFTVEELRSSSASVALQCIVLFPDLQEDYETILPPTITHRKCKRKVPHKNALLRWKRIHRLELGCSRQDQTPSACSPNAFNGIDFRSHYFSSRQPVPHPPSSPHASSPPVPSANASAPESLAAAEEAPPSSPSTPAATAGDDVPPRPVFKAPLLEDEDLPPRPTYTELHPEPEELDALPRLQTRKKPRK
ncbi:hypothetical protein EV361DRAFT_869691 [Lentinula raphanica]|uniref:Uncharacterized protein n=1 Tax=Lentinula raphanica TaxID=153919 RepID=A0AA38UAY2_9AGAR|nr:hypothetical protein F5880DRAFT_1733557 [Lentinula raphanica]KAJ3835949.1 hypothetical protein F5878DRAFT_711747 [Lentinula raphanica]KAJ3969929.1 hypothetical protein EV361DRAFT_869691 [Lentinula raphanica]